MDLKVTKPGVWKGNLISASAIYHLVAIAIGVVVTLVKYESIWSLVALVGFIIVVLLDWFLGLVAYGGRR